MAKSPPRTVGIERNLISEHESWEGVYQDLKPEDLPWNAGGPDADLVRLVRSGQVEPGPAVDLGAGPGHEAVFLAKEGFRVLAVDIAPTAVKLAQLNARKSGVERNIKFLVKDVLYLPVSKGDAVLVNDRGCLHVLAPSQREAYVSLVYRLLVPGGLLVLKTLSDKEPPGAAPYRFRKEELRALFSKEFEVQRLEDSVFEGPRRSKAWQGLFRKKNEERVKKEVESDLRRKKR